MGENLLKREFLKKDVQRMRNIITKNYGDKTTTQIGYTKEHVEHVEGDIWNEGDKQWTIKNGIKQTLTKLDAVRKRISMPLLCPKCSHRMNNPLDKTMYSIHNICFNCVIEHETELKRLGQFDEYQLNINKQGLTYHLKEMENVLLELLMGPNNESFVTEGGDIEVWKSNDSLRQTAIIEIQEYIQKIKDTLNS